MGVCQRHVGANWKRFQYPKLGKCEQDTNDTVLDDNLKYEINIYEATLI